MKIKTGCVGWRTVQQAAMLAAIGGPVCFTLGMGGGSLLWCCVAMFAAPFVVDMIRPVVVK